MVGSIATLEFNARELKCKMTAKLQLRSSHQHKNNNNSRPDRPDPPNRPIPQLPPSELPPTPTPPASKQKISCRMDQALGLWSAHVVPWRLTIRTRDPADLDRTEGDGIGAS